MKLDQAETMIQKLRSDSRQRLATAIHEAGHSLVAGQIGIPSWYDGSAIEHVMESDAWIVTFGRTQVPIKCYQRLTAEQMARLAVAGRVAETVLLGAEPIESSECDFESFLLSGKGRPSELIAIWKRAEEQLVKEFRADINLQRAIVHEAAIFESQIFPDCLDSVREPSKEPSHATVV